MEEYNQRESKKEGEMEKWLTNFQVSFSLIKPISAISKIIFLQNRDHFCQLLKLLLIT